MDAIDIQDAIVTRIRDIVGRPNLVYANDSEALPLPRWRLQTASSTSRGQVINRSIVETDAEVMVLVETEAGEYDGQAGQLIKLLLAAFPLYERFSGVQIMTPPKVQAPYSTGSSYAVPVIIRGRAY